MANLRLEKRNGGAEIEVIAVRRDVNGSRHESSIVRDVEQLEAVGTPSHLHITRP